MMEQKSFSDLAQNFIRWSSGGMNLFVFRKIVTSFFQIGKKSDLVLKFENFRSKTRARRDLFFHEVWLLDQKHKREEAFFFHEFWILVQKHERGEAFFFMRSEFPPPASLARAVKKKEKKKKIRKKKKQKRKRTKNWKGLPHYLISASSLKLPRPPTLLVMK